LKVLLRSLGADCNNTVKDELFKMTQAWDKEKNI